MTPDELVEWAYQADLEQVRGVLSALVAVINERATPFVVPMNPYARPPVGADEET